MKLHLFDVLGIHPSPVMIEGRLYDAPLNRVDGIGLYVKGPLDQLP